MTFITDIQEINVVASFGSFLSGKSQHRITPHRFMMKNGEVLHIAKVRRRYTDTVGDSLHLHFVVRTKDDRYFDIVYDSKKIMWYKIIEIEDALMFND